MQIEGHTRLRHAPLRYALLLVASLSAGACTGSGPAGAAPAEQPASKWPLDPVSGLRVPAIGPVPPLPDWADNPVSPAKAQLGRILFTDMRLSGSGSVSCASCHLQFTDYQSNLPRDTPARSAPALTPVQNRHTPSLFNVVHAKRWLWDGAESDLFAATALQLANANMNLSRLPAGDNWAVDVPEAQRQLVAKLTQEIPGYVALFQAAFGVDITTEGAEATWTLTGKALATYLRDAQSRDSAFDDWNAGGETELSPEALLGLEIFLGKGLCISCHSGPLLSDFGFHNLSLMKFDADGEPLDAGRARVTGLASDRGAFKTPMLRSVARTSPYFHDGSEAVLSAVIAHHSSEAARSDPNHDLILDAMARLDRIEVAAVVAFLKTLVGEMLPMEGTPPPFPP